MTDTVICLANRRWSCWYDRSQHLMAQCAQERTTVFIEEPEFDVSGPDVEISETRTGVITMIPHLPAGLPLDEVTRAQRRALDFMLAHLGATNPILWYYAPQALGFTEHITASAIVYDALLPADGIGRRHQQLLERANLVFTPETPDAHTWPELWQQMWSQVESVTGRHTVSDPANRIDRSAIVAANSLSL